MTLHKKCILITSLIIITLIAIIFITSKFILINGIKKLEEKGVQQNAQQVLNALSNDISFLNDLTGDYAAWDDTCDFIKNGNSEYISSNFVDETFESQRLNIIMIIDSMGKIVYSKGFDLENKKEITISDRLYQLITENRFLINHSYEQSSVTGILSFKEMPLIIASRPIVSSDLKGPIFGTIIMGRFFDTSEIDRLSERTGLPLMMYTINEGQIPSDFQTALNHLSGENSNIFIRPLNKKNIAGYIAIKDIFDHSRFILKMEQPRDIYNQGLVMIHYFFWWLLGTILMFTVLLIFFFKKMVLSRLIQLSTSIIKVGNSGELSARVEMSGNDEVAHVAKEVNEMLQSLEYYHCDLEDKETRLKLITNNMMDMIYQIDENGIVKYVSPSSQHIIGYNYEDILGEPSIKLVHPDDIDSVIKNREEIKRCGSKRMELRIRHRDGHYIWVENIGNSLLNEHDECIGIIYNGRDITDRKKVEEELQRAYDELEIRVQERTFNLSKANEELSFEVNERKRAEEALQYQLNFEKLTAQISTRFINLNTEKTDEAINQALKTVGKFVGADRCYIFLFNSDNRTMDNTHEWCNDGIEPEIDNLKGLPLEIFPWWIQKLKKLENICISRVVDMPIEAAAEKEILLAQSIQSLVVVPIEYGKSVIGYLGFDWVKNEKNIFSEHITLLTMVSEIFSNALKHMWDEETLATQKEHLSVTLRSISDGVISVDTNGRVVLINKATEEITGWTNEEVKGMLIVDILQIIDRKADTDYCDKIQKMLNGEYNDIIFFNSILVTKDGTKKVISYSSAPMVEKDNKVIGFVIVIRDITEQKKVEGQLALSQKMESIGALTAGIAHEINTPMQYIGDNTVFLKDAFSDLNDIVKQGYDCIEGLLDRGIESTKCLEKIREKINEVDFEYLLSEIPVAIEQSLDGIKRVRKLVLTLKDFSHPGNKEKMLTDINQGINGTISISHNEWKYVADMETVLDTNLPLVYCVIDEINQVVLNMIINAAHAIKEAVDKDFYSRGKITIATKNEGDFLKIIISDNGVGIPETRINRIYDPFFTTKEVGKGTGQGLAISHDIIVNKHQGLIEIESEEGKGTTFTICLPLTDLVSVKKESDTI